jgi:hypothetical protein
VAFLKGTTLISGCSAVAVSLAGNAQCRVTTTAKGSVSFTARFSGSSHVAPAQGAVTTTLH